MKKFKCFENENTDTEVYCDVLLNILSDLTSEIALKRELESTLKEKDLLVKDMLDQVENKGKRIAELEFEVQKLHKIINETKNGKFFPYVCISKGLFH